MISRAKELARRSLALIPRLDRRAIRQLALLGAFFLFFALFLKLSANVFWDLEDATEIQHWDELALRWVASHRSPLMTRIAVDLTALGSASVVGLLVGIFFVVFALLGDWFAVFHLVAASVGAGLCSVAFKALLERPRPTLVDPLVEATGFSFPSGHALTATALYLTFALLSARHFPGLKGRVAIVLLGVVVALLVGLTRLYLGVHYPTDVLSGMLLGSAWAFLVAAATAELTRRLAR